MLQWWLAEVAARLAESLFCGLRTALRILLAGVRWELRVETAGSAEGSPAAVGCLKLALAG